MAHNALSNTFLYCLAPIEGYTDNAFRTLCYRHGADLTFTEMARLDALVRRNASTWERTTLLNDTPTVIQLIGNKEEQLAKFLSQFSDKKESNFSDKNESKLSNFQGFNLNIACPSPQFVKLGLGCAMIKRVAKVQKLVEVIKNKGYKASIKMRLGLNKYELDKKAYLNIIKNVDADYFVVHARHGADTYENKTHDEVYEECVAKGKTIIANGDIDSVEKVEKLKSVGVKGVMIGKPAIQNPAIFDLLKNKSVPSFDALKKEYLEITKKLNSNHAYMSAVLRYMGASEQMKRVYN